MPRPKTRWLLRRALLAACLYALSYTALNFIVSSDLDAALGDLESRGIPTRLLPEHTQGPEGEDAGPLWRAAAELWASVPPPRAARRSPSAWPRRRRPAVMRCSTTTPRI